MSSDSGQPTAAVAALILNLKTLQLVCQQWWPTHCLPAPGSQLLPSSPQPAKTPFCAVPLAFELMSASLVIPKSVSIFHMDSTGNKVPRPTMVDTPMYLLKLPPQDSQLSQDNFSYLLWPDGHVWPGELKVHPCLSPSTCCLLGWCPPGFLRAEDLLITLTS